MDWLLPAGHELIDNPRLVPITNTDRTGSVVAMYFTNGDDPEYLFFDSDGAKPYRLAENTLDFCVSSPSATRKSHHRICTGKNPMSRVFPSFSRHCEPGWRKPSTCRSPQLGQR